MPGSNTGNRIDHVVRAYIIGAWAGLPTDLPAATPAGAASASVIALLKTIVNLLFNLGGAPGTVATFTQATHATVGTTYVAMASQVANSFRFVNSTAVSLQFRLIGTDPAEVIEDGDSVSFPCVTNMNEWEFRREDVVATPVSIIGTAQDA